MSTNVGAIDFALLLNSNPFNKGLKTTSNIVKNCGIESSLKKIGKVAIAAFSVKSLVDFTKECLNLGSNLAEVQNVVDVTFGNLNSEVDKFAQNAIEQFGLGQTVTKKYVGTFGAMAKAFNFSNKEALAMSETLTGLTGDVASFYNLSTDEAYTKLKSVFTGETETLKDLGVVMTQNALDQYALANSYGKTTSKMSEQEKTALRYKFVLDKLSIAQGDFARTSDSWANQTRVLGLRFNELKATLGQGFINVFTPIVKGINLVLGKLQVLANVFKAFTEKVFGNAGGNEQNAVSNLADDAINASDAVGGIGESAKKTAKDLKSLASFDTAQILKSDNDTDSSSGNGGISGSIAMPNIDYSNLDPTKAILEEFENIDFYKIGKVVGEKINFALEKIPWEKIQSISKSIGHNIAEFLNGGIEAINWNLVGNTIAQGLNTAIYFGYEFVTTFDWKQWGKAIGDTINGFFDNVDWSVAGQTLSEGVKGVLTYIYTAIRETDWEKIGESIGTFLKNIDWKGILSGLEEIIAEALISVVELAWGTVTSFFTDEDFNLASLWESLKLTTTSGMEMQNKIIDEGAKKLLENMGLTTEQAGEIWENKWQIMGDYLKITWENFKLTIKNKTDEVLTNISEFVSLAKERAINKFSELKNVVINKVIEIKDGIKNKFQEAYNSIRNIFGNIGTFFNNIWRKCKKYIFKPRNKYWKCYIKCSKKWNKWSYFTYRKNNK